MSYRTYIEDEQVFGNNEYYSEWIEFVKSQGIEVDEDGCYSGEIKEFMPALFVVESIVLRLNREREALKEKWNGRLSFERPILSLFDFQNIPPKVENQDYETSLFDELFGIVKNSYAFMPYAFFKACEDKLEKDHVFATPNHFYCFKLKVGETIHIEAH